MDRLQMLKDLLAHDPKNTFARYGLAMEYSSRGELENALVEFHTILEAAPDYVPAYLMLAQALSRSGRLDEAKSTLREGIVRAQKAGDGHAQSEMQGMLEELAG